MVCDDGGPWATSFTNEALPNNYKAYSTTVLQRSKVIIVRYTTLRHNGLWEGIHIIYFRYHVKEFVLLMFKIMSHVDSHFRCGVDIVYFISYYTTVIASAFFFLFQTTFFHLGGYSATNTKTLALYLKQKLYHFTRTLVYATRAS